MQTRALKRAAAASGQDNLASICIRLQRAFASAPAHQPVSLKHAAVLVPLFENAEGQVRVLLTQRASSLSTHAGEVSLPGGKRDPEDADDVATALREAREELGLADVQVLGCLRPFLSKHLLSVTPVFGRIAWPCELRPNPAEVAHVFDVPLDSFLSSDGSRYDFRDTTATFGGVKYRLHFFRHGDFTVWGLTAAILIEAAAAALGRQPDFAVMPGARPYTDLCYDGERVSFRASAEDECPQKGSSQQ